MEYGPKNIAFTRLLKTGVLPLDLIENCIAENYIDPILSSSFITCRAFHDVQFDSH